MLKKIVAKTYAKIPAQKPKILICKQITGIGSEKESYRLRGDAA